MDLKLKVFRVNAGLSIAEMAKLLKVGKSSVSRWERGEQPIPKRHFLRYCEICKIDHQMIQSLQKKEKIK